MLLKLKKILPLVLVLFCFFIFPLVLNVWAAAPAPIANQPQGLVPCGKGDAGPADCTLDSLITLANNLLSFAFYAASLIAAGLIVYAGGKMVYYASTNPGESKKAKSILYNVVIGYAIILIAWLVVRDLISFFAGPSGPLREAINKVFQ